MSRFVFLLFLFFIIQIIIAAYNMFVKNILYTSDGLDDYTC